jgi:ADP-ribose pyrophosphatase
MKNNKEIKQWSVLDEQDVSPSPWFPVMRHTVKLANGNIIDDYYFAPLGDVVMVLAITPANEVVLVKQYKHGLGEITIEIPGGMQQKNKSVIDSALNELEEETGIKVLGSELIPLGKIAINATKLKQVTYGFVVFNAEFNSTQKLDSTEDIEIITLPAPEVLQMVMNGEIWTTDTVSFILKAALKNPDIFGLEIKS